MRVFVAPVLLYIVTLFLNEAFGQENIPIGTWRTHFSYNQVSEIAEAGNLIYAASQNGLFYFDKQDHSITKITKLDGLQGGVISAMAYDNSSKLLLVGYQSGNMDLIDGFTISNFDLTTNSQIQGSKKINHITFYQGYAYLSTDFGVLKFDLAKKEVKESYRELGLDTSNKPEALQVNMGTVYHDSLFIATEQGVLAANLVENINLLDYQNWRRFDDADGIPQQPINIVAAGTQQILAGINDDGIYQYKAGAWVNTGIFPASTFNSIDVVEDFLIVADSSIYQMTPDLTLAEITIPIGDQYSSAIIDDTGKYWLGSLRNGMISNFEGQFLTYLPSGPASDHVFKLNFASETLYAASGGFTNNGNALGRTAGFYAYKSGTWENYNAEGAENSIPEFKDIVAATTFNNKIYLASMGYGLLEIDADGKQKIYNESNSTLVNINPPGRNVKVPKIISTGTDLWVLNYGTNTVHRLNQQGEWSSYVINNSSAAFATDMIIVGEQLWLVVAPSAGGGILVFNPGTGDSRYLSSTSGDGGLPSDNVYTLALDKAGFVWAGTDLGVSVFSNPAFVMSGTVDGIEPIFENRQLLRDETVADIEIDGGDRKWMATQSGVWLFDAEADRQIQFFNVENSPLPDNDVLDVEINDNSGEVFFATSEGIVSWRGTSTTGENVHTNVRIFPNPVRADFKGTVGISGLVTDADIKITDVSGKLIWKTKANGGTATWRVKDYNGNRAATGIYLVFSSSADGEETFVGKIAVVN